MRRTMAHLAVLRITLRRPDGKSGPVQKWLKVVVQLLPMWRPKAAANHDQPVSRDAARGYRAGGLSDAPICLSCVWCRPVPEHGKWRITQLTSEFSSGIRSMGFMMYGICMTLNIGKDLNLHVQNSRYGGRCAVSAHA